MVVILECMCEVVMIVYGGECCMFDFDVIM